MEIKAAYILTSFNKIPAIMVVPVAEGSIVGGSNSAYEFSWTPVRTVGDLEHAEVTLVDRASKSPRAKMYPDTGHFVSREVAISTINRFGERYESL